MTIKTEMTTLLKQIHNSISESDSFFLDLKVPSRSRIMQSYPEIVDSVGIESLSNLFSTLKSDSLVECNSLALSMQELLNKLCGRVVLIKTLSKVPLIKPCIRPVRFPDVTFNNHLACLDIDSMLVYDPNLLIRPVQLNNSRDFTSYQKQAFEDSPFLLKTSVMQ